MEVRGFGLEIGVDVQAWLGKTPRLPDPGLRGAHLLVGCPNEGVVRKSRIDALPEGQGRLLGVHCSGREADEYPQEEGGGPEGPKGPEGMDRVNEWDHGVFSPFPGRWKGWISKSGDDFRMGTLPGKLPGFTYGRLRTSAFPAPSLVAGGCQGCCEEGVRRRGEPGGEGG